MAEAEVFSPDFKKQYDRAIIPVERALKQLLLDFSFFADDLGADTIYHVDSRLKELPKVREKLLRKNYSSITQVQDLGGMRIVVMAETDKQVVEGFFHTQARLDDIRILE